MPVPYKFYFNSYHLPGPSGPSAFKNPLSIRYLKSRAAVGTDILNKSEYSFLVILPVFFIYSNNWVCLLVREGPFGSVGAGFTSVPSTWISSTSVRGKPSPAYGSARAFGGITIISVTGFGSSCRGQACLSPTIDSGFADTATGAA